MERRSPNLSNGLLNGMNQEKLIKNGKKAWYINAISLALSAATMTAAVETYPIGGLLSTAASAFDTAALIVYIYYLHECGKVFEPPDLWAEGRAATAAPLPLSRRIICLPGIFAGRG